MDLQDVITVVDERFERRLAQEAGAIRLEMAGVRRELTDQAAALRQEIAGVRQELTKESAALRQEIAGVRQEITKESAALRQEIAGVRQDMARENTALREEMAQRFDELKEKMADWRTDIIKWSFLFWTGQVLTTIGFLLVILRTR